MNILPVFVLLFLSNFALPHIQQEIVVTASAIEEPIDSTPASVTVITRDQLEERQARDVAGALREVPGLGVSRTGSAGKATSLFTRGANSTHTLVLWNGIEINNPYFAGYDWGRVSTLGVERIEVVRGPYSALYGSDAVAGVVNIFTEPSASRLGGDLEIGERERINAALDGAWVTSSFRVSGGYEHRQDEGWNGNDDFRQDAAQAGISFGGSRFSGGLLARHTAYELGIPFNVDASGAALVPSLSRRQDGSELQLALPLRLRAGRTVYELTLSESRRDDDFADPEDPFGFTEASTESTTTRARASLRTKTAVGTVIAGGEYETAEVDDVTTFGVNLRGDERTSRSLFVEDRYSSRIGSGSVELLAGLRHDHYDTFGSELSPRLGAAWVTKSGKIRLAYGEGFRAPSVGELYFPGFLGGNPDLQPERSRTLEAGVDRRAGKVTFSLTVFFSDFENLIVFDNASFKFNNIGEASSRGVEVGAEGELAPQVQAELSYTYLDTEQEESGEPLLRRPRHSGSFRVSYRGERLRATLAAMHSGERADLLPVFPYSIATNRAFTTLDLVVQWPLRDLIPYVKLENLTNEDYEEVLGYRSPRRRALIGLRYVLK